MKLHEEMAAAHQAPSPEHASSEGKARAPVSHMTAEGGRSLEVASLFHLFFTSVKEEMSTVRHLPGDNDTGAEAETVVGLSGKGDPSALNSGSHAQRRRHRYRVRVAVVGEGESGRTSLCTTLKKAASCRSAQPLVISGAEACLHLAFSVASIQTYDLDGRSGATPTTSAPAAQPSASKGSLPLEVTIVDSGPAPLTASAGVCALAEADVVLLCVPLYCIKQVVAPPEAGQQGRGSKGSLPDAVRATQMYIHQRDTQLLRTLLTLISSRCSPSNEESPPPHVLLVGTFHDTLRDTSITATHTILRSLKRLCSDVSKQCPSIIHVCDTIAVSATQGTCVCLHSEVPCLLEEWWRRMLGTVVGSWRALQPFSSPGQSFFRSTAIHHLAAHPNRLLTLQACLLQLHRCGTSPRLLNFCFPNKCNEAAAWEHASPEAWVEDRRIGCRVVDFLMQLKSKKGVWWWPLPRLWRIAFALGMHSKEQLYLVLRQLEVTGEVMLLGRALAFLRNDSVDCMGQTNELVCLRPALLRASFTLLYTYSRWATQRQSQHLECLRGVDFDACGALDPDGDVARGLFSARLLFHISKALKLEGSPGKEAAELLSSVLVTADLAYWTTETTVSERPILAPSPAHSPTPSGQAPDVRAAFTNGASESFFPNALPRQALCGANPSFRLAMHQSRASLPQSPRTGSSAGETLLVSGIPFSAVNALTIEHTFESEKGEPKESRPHDPLQGTPPSLISPEHLFSSRPPTAASFWNSFGDDGTTPEVLRDAFESATSPREATTRERTTRRFLVVPTLHMSPTVCPESLIRLAGSYASSTAMRLERADGIFSSQVRLRLDPFPCDVIASLTCRLGGLALRVERTHRDAALFTFAIPREALCRTGEIFASRRHACINFESAELADACVFLHCEITDRSLPEDTAGLHMLIFAKSAAKGSFLELAICKEVKDFLLQRMPGVTLSTSMNAEEVTAPRSPILAPQSISELVHELLIVP